MLNHRRKRGMSAKGIFFLFFFTLLIAGGAVSYFLFFENEPPQVSFADNTSYLGKEAVIGFRATDVGNGLRTLSVVAEQNGVRKDLYSKVYPRTGYSGQVGPAQDSQEVTFQPLKSGFKEGEITLEIVAYDFSANNFLAGNRSSIKKTMTVDTKAPRLGFLHTEKYMTNGGAGMSIYTVDDITAESGVSINGNFFKGYPVSDGRENVFISYFALPFGATDIHDLSLVATDPAGNVSKMRFSTKFKLTPKVKDRINISDRFLDMKIPEFEQNSPYELKGSDVEKYIFINNRMRQDNNKKIANICKTTSENRHWHGRFLRMAGASPAGYAEYRSYYYKGKLIDKQVHLGMDIASTKRANIYAANAGEVIYTNYHGIYGNMIIIDHGQGIHSLYSHMTQINVQVGDMVTKETIIALTGSTGMSGGDHLHFSILVGGVFVNPREWWDASWIDVNIDGPILDSKF